MRIATASLPSTNVPWKEALGGRPTIAELELDVRPGQAARRAVRPRLEVYRVNVPETMPSGVMRKRSQPWYSPAVMRVVLAGRQIVVGRRWPRSRAARGVVRTLRQE